MRLMELFNTKNEWKWNEHHPSKATAVISIDEYRYSVVIRKYSFVELEKDIKNNNLDMPNWLKLLSETSSITYSIIFYLSKEYQPRFKDGYTITDTGHQYSVFTTIMEIMKDFSQLYPVEWWYFTADEPSRKKLYNRMINRFEKTHFNIDIDFRRHYVVKA